MKRSVVCSRIVPVAGGQPYASDEELPGGVDGTGSKVVLEDVEALVAQRLAVRDAWPLGVDLLDGMEDGPDGGFRSAAQAIESAGGYLLADASGQRDRYPVTAEHHDAQAGQQGGAVIAGRGKHQFSERRDGVPDRHADVGSRPRPKRWVCAFRLGEQGRRCRRLRGCRRDRRSTGRTRETRPRVRDP